jgi:hypothetical protein
LCSKGAVKDQELPMKRLLALAPALLLAVPALAQDTPAAPEAGYQNLWCHFAFVTTSTQIPTLPAAELEAARAAGADATPEQLQLLEMDGQIQTVVTGIPVLLDTATETYTEAGFTTEQLEAAKTALQPKVTEQVMGGGVEAEFTFDQCLALLPPAETTTP